MACAGEPSYVAEERYEMVSREINLLSSLPKSNRNVRKRSVAKTADIIKEAKKFGHTYFDGRREQGYGGYKYDGRWKSVAKDIVKFFNLKSGAKILDVGCAKGFLLHDLMLENKQFELYGLDISKYALARTSFRLKAELTLGTAEKLPYPDKYFDLVISINTIHNLPREGCIKALQEIERVGKAAYVVVDAFYTEAEREIFQSWCLTAETYGTPDFWLGLFKEANYSGFYGWNVL